MSGAIVSLRRLIAEKVPTVDPAKFPDEEFELWSIPAFDAGRPEIVKGDRIGSSKQVVEAGDVLLSKIVPHIRRAWVVSGVGPRRKIASGEWIVFRGTAFDPEFLRHILVSSEFHSLFMTTVAGVGGSLLRARPQAVKALSIFLPPLIEQKRIAAILDQSHGLHRLWMVYAHRLTMLRRSVFSEMFLREVSGVVVKASLAEVVAENTIVTYGIVQAGDEHPGGVPYIRTGDIKHGAIVTTSLRHTSPEIASKFERSRVKAGEIVMSIRATVGTTAVVPPELDGANLTQGTARIAPGPRVKGSYLLDYLRSPAAQQWIEKQVKGATFREITLSRLRELPIPLPPIVMQEQFASFVQRWELEYAKAVNAAHIHQALFTSLQHRAFRGEL